MRKTVNWAAGFALAFAVCTASGCDLSAKHDTAVQVSFVDVKTNGEALEPTTVLTFAFDKVIDGLSAEDITLTDNEEYYTAPPEFRRAHSRAGSLKFQQVTSSIASR